MRPRFGFTSDAFGSRIARKLFLGYIVPLVVVIIAGMLLPVFVWSTLDRYRTDFEQAADFANRVSDFEHTSGDVRDVSLRRDFKTPVAEREARLTARQAYANQRVNLLNWLDDNPDPVAGLLLEGVDKAFARYSQKTVPDFHEVQAANDRLQTYATQRRDDALQIYRRADLLRRSALVVIPALAIALSVLIGRHVALGLTQPLVSLTRAATGVEQGEHTLLLEGGRGPEDEIGDLRDAFVRMVGAIGRREAVLRAQNEALNAMRRRLEAVLNATDDGIAMLDRAGVFSVVSHRFAAIFGMEVADFQDQSFARIAPRILRRFREPSLARHRLREVLRSPDEVTTETFDVFLDRPRVLRIFSAPVRGELAEGGGTSVLGRVIVLRDVTRETEVDRMKTEFVATVSHELRTPLTAIKGYVDLILGGQTGPLTEVQREFLSLTGDSTERLTELINDMLDISRIEAGSGHLRRQSVPYAGVVERTVQLLAGQARHAGIDLQAEPPDPALTVIGDPDRIGQALANLISNAIKYTPSGGTVRVTFQTDAEQVTTFVADTGIGITREDRDRIFEKFYRADNSTTRETGGTGLGLAITRAIVERLGGTISVESTPGQGSVFAFTLPRAADVGEDQRHRAIQTSGRHRLYLVVDGNPERRDRMVQSLRQRNTTASAASTNTEGVRRARGLRPDAVLVDLFSPGIDGEGFLLTLAADLRARKIPVFLTGASDGVHLVRPSRLPLVLRGIQPVAETPDGPRAIHAIGPESLVEAIRDSREKSDTTPIVTAASGETALTDLLETPPALIAIDMDDSGDGVEIGDYLRAVRQRWAALSPQVLLIGEFADNVQALAPPGESTVSLDDLAASLDERLAVDDDSESAA